MTRYLDSILDAVGGTPLVRLARLGEGLPATILAKVESFNPGGSSKDRIGLAMIGAAEAAGLLKPGGTIVGGHLGQHGRRARHGRGRASDTAACSACRTRCRPRRSTSSRPTAPRSWSARPPFRPSRPSTTTRGRPDRARDARRVPHQPVRQPGQPGGALPDDRPRDVGAAGGKIDAFVAASGTGGTISGAGRYLKEKNPKVRIVGADPDGLDPLQWLRAPGEAHTYRSRASARTSCPRPTTGT